MNSDIKTLKELSFEVIRKNFSRYTTAYNLTEDEALKKSLCFLQRVYTPTLFSALEQNKELKEEHFDFLLNEYLKKLDLGTLLSCSTKEKIVEKLIPVAHSLHELSCYSDYRYEEDAMFIFEKLIPFCNNVKKIVIPCCNNDLIKLISSNCSHLLELSIEKTNTVTGDGMKTLCLDPNGQIQAKCPLKLLNLSYTDTDLSIEDIAFLLKNMPTLEEVLYPRLPEVIESIHQLDIDNNIVSNTKQFNLQSLDFMPYHDSSQLTKLLALCTERCPKLKKLSIPIFSAKDMDLICHFSNLEDLTIIFFGEPDVLDINSFLIRKGKDLKILTVDSFSFSVSTLVENCSNVETLSLRNIQYQELNKNSTKVLNKLHNLHLESIIFLDYHCADSMMLLLNSSPNLESLSLHYCDFSESDIIAKLSTFSLNCNLSHLQFDCSDVGVDLLQQFIMNCNSIKTLSLDSCENISIEDICMLNQTIEASNRKISINFTEEQSNLSNSDFEVEDYDGYDVFDEYNGYDFYDDDDEYDGYEDYDDYEDGIYNDIW